VVTDNQVGAGSASCDQTATFSLVISLVVGTNSLEAYHLDNLNQAGPTSNTVLVIYQPGSTGPQILPATPTLATPAVTSGATNPGSNQLTITVPYRFDGIQSDQSFTLHGSLEGGTPPYALQINWGDGSQTLLSQPLAGAFTEEHTYNKPGQFTIKLAASDSAGVTTYFQTTAAVGGTPAVTPVSPTPPAPVVPAYKLAIIWPVFLVTCLTAFSFWLGEFYDRKRAVSSDTRPPASS
jgi:hypothetical protein